MDNKRKYLLTGERYTSGGLFCRPICENVSHSFYQETDEQAVQTAREYAAEFNISNPTLFAGISIGDTVGLLAPKKKK